MVVVVTSERVSKESGSGEDVMDLGILEELVECGQHSAQFLHQQKRYFYHYIVHMRLKIPPPLEYTTTFSY